MSSPTLDESARRYGLGLAVLGVSLTDAQPPAEVQPDFAAAQSARSDLDRKRNEAKARAESVLIAAKAKVRTTEEVARAGADRAIALAKGRAARFVALLAEAERSRRLTVRRLYLDGLRDGLARPPQGPAHARRADRPEPLRPGEVTPRGLSRSGKLLVVPGAEGRVEEAGGVLERGRGRRVGRDQGRRGDGAGRHGADTNDRAEGHRAGRHRGRRARGGPVGGGDVGRDGRCLDVRRRRPRTRRAGLPRRPRRTSTRGETAAGWAGAGEGRGRRARRPGRARPAWRPPQPASRPSGPA